MQLRYDEERSIYRDCRFCGGRGCLACPGEAEKAYKFEFPDGPQPIATFKTDDPKDMKSLKNIIHGAFGEGKGVDDLIDALARHNKDPKQGA